MCLSEWWKLWLLSVMLSWLPAPCSFTMSAFLSTCFHSPLFNDFYKVCSLSSRLFLSIILILLKTKLTYCTHFYISLASWPQLDVSHTFTNTVGSWLHWYLLYLVNYSWISAQLICLRFRRTSYTLWRHSSSCALCLVFVIPHSLQTTQSLWIIHLFHKTDIISSSHRPGHLNHSLCSLKEPILT